MEFVKLLNQAFLEMIKEAIILAGGEGRRLQSIVSDVPKSMALINDRPFLEYQLNYLESWGINHVVLAIGFKSEVIISHFGSEFNGIKIDYQIEKEALGTGGALKQAFDSINGLYAFILNGDTIFDMNLKRLFDTYRIKNADFCIALRFNMDTDRYGSVKIDQSNRIVGFIEKSQNSEEEYINGGVYLTKKHYFLNLNLPDKFSLEKNFFESHYKTEKIHGIKCHSFFMDIGVPEDYILAQDEFKRLQY